MKQRWKVWLVVLAVLLVTVAAAVPIGIHFMEYIAPKAALSYALNDVFSQLEVRLEGNPLLKGIRMLQWNGKYRAEVHGVIPDDRADDIHLDSMICADWNANRILAENQIRSAQRNMDVNVYLDSKFMAISSEALVAGNYYGITYDTFPEDIRSFPLLEYLLPEQMIQDWEQEIVNIRDIMNRNDTIPSVPQLSGKEIRTLLLGALALPCQIDKAELAVNNEKISCKKLSYVAEGINISAIPFAGNMLFDFYLCGNRLVKLDVFMETDIDNAIISFVFGEDYLLSPILIQVDQSKGGEKQSYIASVATTKGDNLYSEDWTVHWEQGREASSVSFSYCYDTETGEMQLTVGQENAEAFFLKESEKGISLETEDFVGLLQVLTGKTQETDRKIVHCSMVLYEGSAVTTPSFKNLDQWSLGDLTGILEGYLGWIS